MQKADVIDGYHIMNLEETVKWKEKTGKEKHIEDAKKIRDYLSNLENKLKQKNTPHFFRGVFLFLNFSL